MTARRACLAALLLLAGCEASTRPVVPSATVPRPAPGLAAAATPEACGGSADSLPVTTDRGIGGTGIGGGATTLADRGIGGTGGFVPGTLRGVRTAERGGGGTGIVGVITGFSSLCINGLAVAVDHPVRVAVDGIARASETLYVGEVAAVEATGPADHLHAVSIGIRHEVSGPISAVDASGTAIEVVGQYVLLTRHTHLATVLHTGDWVAVSGLRDPAGTIRASRVDARAPGEVEVAGVPERVDDAWQIGGLRLLLPPKLVPGADRLVVTGDYAAGTLRVRDASADPLVPAGNGKRHLLIEGYPSVAGNQVRLANELAANVGPAFGSAPPTDQPIILELVSAPGGALLAVSWHEARSGGGNGADHGKPTPQAAPVPATEDPAAVPASPTSVLQPPATPSTTTTTTAVATAAATTTAATATTATAVVTTAATTATTATATTTTTSSTSSASGSTGDIASQPTHSPPGGANSANTANSPPSGTGSSPGSGSSSGSAGGPPASPSPPAPAARAPPMTIGEGHRAAPSASTPGGRAEGGKDGPPGGGSSGTAPGGGPASGTGANSGAGGSSTTVGTTTGTGTTTTGSSTTTTAGAPPAPGGGVNGGTTGTSSQSGRTGGITPVGAAPAAPGAPATGSAGAIGPSGP